MANMITKHLKRILQVYHRAGFTVRYILMDGDFEKVKEKLPSIVVNTTAAKEHMAEAEMTLRTVKEKCRGILGTIPFKNVPRQMKIQFLHFVVLWLNGFPFCSGVSRVFSSQEIIVRWKMNAKKHCRVLPGSYCEVHDEASPSNTMITQTHKWIALETALTLVG